MRNLEDIDRDLSAAREALSSVEGTPAEVYSRIVGYYRSVRNWNRGKREEFGERRLYRLGKTGSKMKAAAPSPSLAKNTVREQVTPDLFDGHEYRLILFVRSSCPACPAAKAAAARLGITVDLINADTPEGMTAAIALNVFSTPTAILLSSTGKELKRALDADQIESLLVNTESSALPSAIPSVMPVAV